MLIWSYALNGGNEKAMQKFKVDLIDAKKRLDVVVGMYLQGKSRTSIRGLIEQGKILVNNKLQKAGYKLKVSDVITIDYDESSESPETTLDLPIIFEDDDCIVIDKPIGLLTHSKGTLNVEATVASFILPKTRKLAGNRAGIVHRLDRATSGVIICAKNIEALKWLQKQFANRKVKKTYFAIIKVGLSPSEAIIDMPIQRNSKKPKQFMVGANGKPAVTKYKVIKSNKNYSLVELIPQTGRTHQLRVHLNQLKHPIVGDLFYNGETASRLFLHAYSLEITLPNKTRQVFVSKLPVVFNEMVKR